MRSFLTLLALTVFSPTLSADDFYFGAVAENRVVRGVLLNSEDGMYLIRTEGGTVGVTQSSVTKIVKTDLSVGAIVAKEEADKPRLAKANADRRQRQAAERDRLVEAMRARESRRMALRAVRGAIGSRGSWRYSPSIGRTYFVRSSNHFTSCYN